jgi:hypothetical protein
MTRVLFHCAACGAAVTKALRHLADRTRLSEADGTDYVPSGFWATDATYESFSPIPRFVVNLRSVAGVGYTASPGYGCCGYSPGVNPNRVCRNGHVVGWEFSDCWTGGQGVWLAAERMLLSDGDAAPFPLVPVHPGWVEANGARRRLGGGRLHRPGDLGPPAGARRPPRGVLVRRSDPRQGLIGRPVVEPSAEVDGLHS